MFLAGKAIGQVLLAERHVEGAEQRIPAGEDEPHVLVEVARRLAVMDLVLGGTDDNVAQPARIGEPYVAVPQIEPGHVPAEEERVDAEDSKVRDSGAVG